MITLSGVPGGSQGAKNEFERISERISPVLGKSVLEYSQLTMAHLKTEQLRLLFLDTKNCLIADELQQTETVHHTPIFPREIVKRALDIGASALILVHNHPSGDPTPSAEDIEMIQRIRNVSLQLGICLHDHIIIGKNRHFTVKTDGLLYEERPKRQIYFRINSTILSMASIPSGNAFAKTGYTWNIFSLSMSSTFTPAFLAFSAKRVVSS